jgi:nucleoid DNA-binding protein
MYVEAVSVPPLLPRYAERVRLFAEIFRLISYSRLDSNRFELMAGPSAEDIINAFAEAVRESLEAGTPIEAPGLGHFDIEHHQSQMVETDDGEARMAPPRDVITFRPDAS